MRIIISILCFTMLSTWTFGQSTNSGETKIHEVKAKETLYSLSRSYNVPINNIIALNPGVEEGLSIGQKVKIPQSQAPKTMEKKEHIVKAKETMFSISKKYGVKSNDILKWNNKSSTDLSIGEILVINPVSNNENSALLSINKMGKKVHIVKEKETLYGISRLYAVTSEDIMQWNRLKNSELNIGQELVVGVEQKTESETKVEKEIVGQKEDKEVQVVTIEDASKPIEVYKDDKPRKVTNASGFEEIVQTGLAELIEGTTESRKYLALHTSARVGTIMKVRNEMNNQMVFVRVIGTIPNTGENDKVLIKLSKAAYDRLGALDKRFRVEVSYMP